MTGASLFPLMGLEEDPPLVSWRAIETAPKDERVDLWVAQFELEGEIVTDCWWNADAAVPDWYHVGADGEPETAASIVARASHWKPLGARVDGAADGGPRHGARDNIGPFLDTWPTDMKNRWNRYFEAAATRPEVRVG